MTTSIKGFVDPVQRIIKMICNDADGLTVEVSKGSGRYCVRMRDDDSGNWLPVARVYSNEGDAVAYAHFIAGIEWLEVSHEEPE